jgi:hypothetical protein
MRKLPATILALGIWLGLGSAGNTLASSLIDYEGFPAGTIVNSLSFGNGVSGDFVPGSITVFGQSLNPGISSNAALIFDAECPGGCTGEDPDLFQPSEGKVMIIAEDLVDANGDGLVDDPDDAMLPGQNITFDFSAFGAGLVSVDQLNVMDIEGEEVGGIIEFFAGGAGGTLIVTAPIPVTGDGGLATVPVGVSGVDFMRVIFFGSGAINNVQITAAPFCGNGMVDPNQGEQCDPPDDSLCVGTCLPDCTCPFEICGDDVVNQPSEECDGAATGTLCDGNCKSDCTCPSCGDGEVNLPGEECDPPDDSLCVGTCLPDCTCPFEICGDDVVNQPSEECDGAATGTPCDGNCKSDCTCPSCGDGEVNQLGEECDPPDDSLCVGACLPDCTCPFEICGDDIVNQPSEECDGAATGTPCDGECLSDCTCPQPICGDGMVNQPSEECDGSDAVNCANLLCREDCTCVPQILRDPARIRFRKTSAELDKLQGHGRVVTEHALEKLTGEIEITLSNPSGIVYRSTLLPGDCTLRSSGRRCLFKDKAARHGAGSRGGIEKFTMKVRGNAYAFNCKAYGDLSTATDPDMTLQIRVGGELYATRAMWKRLSNGWRTTLPPLRR